MAGGVDIETGGGDIDVRKLMGTYVHVSTEDMEPASEACGAVKFGAIYADTLHLITGGALLPERAWMPEEIHEQLHACPK